MHRRCVSKMALRRFQRRSSTVAATSSDPFAPVAAHLAALRASLPALLSAGHPAITEATQYYFKHPSKQVRPLIVLLMAQATNGLGSRWEAKRTEAAQLAAERHDGGGSSTDAGLDWPLTRPDVLNDWNPSQPRDTECFAPTFSMQPPRGAARRHRLTPAPTTPIPTPPTPALSDAILPTQVRLAQIVEMMHTASLLHDDVIDASALRRGAPSAPAAFGNKRAVLAGNFVLGRASVALARLGDAEATELIASVLANLVEGEILQLREVKMGTGPEGMPADGVPRAGATQDAWNVYLQKTYLKTASLMAKGARAAVVLGGGAEGEVWKEVAYAYGRNLGIAFQLVDDVLDYEAASAALGKPGGADLGLGLATGPALYAWEEHPQMGALIARKFSAEGDVEEARDLVLRSAGVKRTRALAQAYADKAVEVLRVLPPSTAREALEALAGVVIGRRS